MYIEKESWRSRAFLRIFELYSAALVQLPWYCITVSRALSGEISPAQCVYALRV